MRVLFADPLPARSLAAIEAAGASCVMRPELTAADLPTEIRGYDVLVVRSTVVTAETFATADRLRLVIRAGSGTNTIDVAAATSRGIAVANVPGRNAIAVAELAFALLLALDRSVPDAVADLRMGRWDKARYGRAQGLYGRDVGVVGLGDIGLAFAERARAFGMNVYTVARADRPASVLARATGAGVRFVADLQELAATCDVISFHVPLTPETRGLVDRDFLVHCRDGAWLINTSRGEIIDDEALLEALDTRGMRAGLDVFNGEPAAAAGTFHSRLAQHPSVYGTHHIGASTQQAQQAVADGVVEILRTFASGTVSQPVNGITAPGEPSATARDVARRD